MEDPNAPNRNIFDSSRNLKPIQRGETDYKKLMQTGPLQTSNRPEGASEQTHYGQGDPNQERREDRVKRENLLRYYEGEYETGKRELDAVNRTLKELENKIRNEEKEVDLLAQEEMELNRKLIQVTKTLKRFRFELRSHKGDQMEKTIVQRRWQSVVKESEEKLKKIKYGDWRSIRK